MSDSLGVLAILVGLELVLGVDNVLVISIFVERVEEARRQTARILGLAFAFVARILMLVILMKLSEMTKPIAFNMSVRDLILLAGGVFLLYKAVKEIHHTVEISHEEAAAGGPSMMSMAAVVTQIGLLDMVFSVDSVITAIGLTSEAWVIITAVIASFSVILLFARQIGEFILSHPTVKILALSFLITIGITITMESFHKHVDKAYIYLPMGFALFVEMLQLRYGYNKKKHLIVEVKGQAGRIP